MTGGIDVNQVMGWFNKEGVPIDDYSQGSYVQDGKRLSFATQSRIGKIFHCGTINGASLSLRVESRVNGISFLDYQFQKEKA